MTERKPPSVHRALASALRSCSTRPEDAATVALAKNYAAAIDDDPALLWRVGPRLLDVLVELGATPKARAAVVPKGGNGDSAKRSSPLDELRERRAARLDDTAIVDSGA